MENQGVSKPKPYQGTISATLILIKTVFYRGLVIKEICQNRLIMMQKDFLKIFVNENIGFKSRWIGYNSFYFI